MRRLVCVLVTVMVVAGLAGCVDVIPDEPEPTGTPTPGDLPREPTLERAGTVTARSNQYAVAGGVLAAATSGGLDGHQLPDGEQQWTVRLPDADQVTQVSAGQGRFVVTYVADGANRTAVVTPEGDLRWHHPGRPLVAAADGDLIITGRYDRSDEFTEVDVEYVARQADSGDPVWTLAGSVTAWLEPELLLASAPATGPPTSRFETQPGEPLPVATWLVFLDERDTLSVVDPASGDLRELSSGRPINGPAHEPGNVRVAGDLVLVRFLDDPQDPTSRLDPVALDLATGEQRWSTEHGITTPPSDCGPVVCLVAFVGGGGDFSDTYGVDRLTGETLWTEEIARRVGPALPGRPDSPLLALTHRTLDAENVEMGMFLHDEQARILAPDTGELLLNLAGWKPLGADGSWLLAYADPDGVDWGSVEDAEIVGGIDIAVVDLAELTVREVGTVPDVVVYETGGIPGIWRFPQETYLGCRAADGWLTCLHPDHEISVWRYHTVG